MHKFEAKRFASRTSGVACLLVRSTSCLLPTVLLSQHDFATGMVAALSLGLADGWSRLWISRTAGSFAAEVEGLVVSSGLASRRIAWADVMAIQTWQRINRVDYVVVHYRSASGMAVATCWEQNGHDELVAFVRACTGAVTPGRETIALAGLQDRAIWAPLFKRLALDVAVASILGFVLGVVGPAFTLGLTAASVSTLLASSRYAPRAPSLVLRDGRWWQSGTDGTVHALQTLPRSLRFWLNALAGNRA